MLDYAFAVLGLQSVMLTVAEFNPAGIRAYQKAGFREFGRRRQCRWMGGQLWDDVYMDCLAPEFNWPTVFPGYRDVATTQGGTGHAPVGGSGEGARPGPTQETSP
jgi:hypothetical protein